MNLSQSMLLHNVETEQDQFTVLLIGFDVCTCESANRLNNTKDSDSNKWGHPELSREKVDRTSASRTFSRHSLWEYVNTTQ